MQRDNKIIFDFANHTPCLVYGQSTLRQQRIINIIKCRDNFFFMCNFFVPGEQHRTYVCWYMYLDACWYIITSTTVGNKLLLAV